jgi:hypothetical protein
VQVSSNTTACQEIHSCNLYQVVFFCSEQPPYSNPVRWHTLLQHNSQKPPPAASRNLPIVLTKATAEGWWLMAQPRYANSLLKGLGTLPPVSIQLLNIPDVRPVPPVGAHNTFGVHDGLCPVGHGPVANTPRALCLEAVEHSINYSACCSTDVVCATPCGTRATIVWCEYPLQMQLPARAGHRSFSSETT